VVYVYVLVGLEKQSSIREEEMGDERVKTEALQIIGAFQVLPRLVVFDLDYTLWPFYWYFFLFFLCILLFSFPSFSRRPNGLLRL
jgi:hypothetical protein